MKILVVGSSHTAAISKAVDGAGDIDALWVKNPKREDAPGDITLDQAIEAVKALEPSDTLALTWIGTYHNIFGLVQHERPFDFFEPDSDEFDETRELIPYALIRDQFSATIRSDSFTRKLSQATKAKVALLSTPPVKGNNEFIHSKMKNYRGHDVAAAGVTPARIRAKLWRLEMSCIEAYCKDIGAEFISAPEESLTADGYLRPELYGSDATHANAAYGAMVVDQLISLEPAPHSPQKHVLAIASC